MSNTQESKQPSHPTDGLTYQREAELTQESKAAIRGYLLKLVTAPAIVLSILSFMLGLSIREGATGQALTKALEQVTPKIQDATATAAAAAASAEQTKIAAAKTMGELQQMKTLQDALQNKDSLVADLTPIIKGDLQKALGSGQAIPVRQEGNAEELCPPGTYMVGVRYQIDPGGPRGITSRIIPIYRPFFTTSGSK
jgi:hypothetical protein